MHFHECSEGGYRIYAGALEAPAGAGYIAAVVVTRIRGASTRDGVAYKDEAISCGHRWRTADEAIHCAINTGRRVVREQTEALRC